MYSVSLSVSSTGRSLDLNRGPSVANSGMAASCSGGDPRHMHVHALHMHVTHCCRSPAWSRPDCLSRTPPEWARPWLQEHMHITRHACTCTLHDMHVHVYACRVVLTLHRLAGGGRFYGNSLDVEGIVSWLTAVVHQSSLQPHHRHTERWGEGEGEGGGGRPCNVTIADPRQNTV